MRTGKTRDRLSFYAVLIVAAMINSTASPALAYPPGQSSPFATNTVGSYCLDPTLYSGWPTEHDQRFN